MSEMKLVTELRSLAGCDARAGAPLGACMLRAADEIELLHTALSEAVAVIKDYLEYEHSGDPWEEDARAMGEMDINDYARAGKLANAIEILKRNAA